MLPTFDGNIPEELKSLKIDVSKSVDFGIKSTPIVRQIVWHYPNESSTFHEEDPFAGIMCQVWDDTHVDVAIFEGNGELKNSTSVYLIQPECKAPEGGDYCCRMPDQRDQAAKTGG